MDEFFERRKDLFNWVRPEGGCIGFVNYKAAESIKVFCAKLVKDTGVLLIPASTYDINSNHFRIGFGRKNMPEVLAIFDEYLS